MSSQATLPGFGADREPESPPEPPGWIYVSAHVWAQFGQIGWSPAVVMSVGSEVAYLVFTERRGKSHTGGRLQKGKRRFDRLQPRDPDRRGDDKPPNPKDPAYLILRQSGGRIM